MTDFPLVHPSLATHPLSKTAGFMDDVLSSAGEFFWPASNGPIENLFRLIEFGSYFVLPGVWQSAMFIASLLGYSLQGLGKYFDQLLGTTKMSDVANLNTSQTINKISDQLDVRNVQRILDAGKLYRSADDVVSAIIKIAEEEGIDKPQESIRESTDTAPQSTFTDTSTQTTTKKKKDKKKNQDKFRADNDRPRTPKEIEFRGLYNAEAKNSSDIRNKLNNLHKDDVVTAKRLKKELQISEKKKYDLHLKLSRLAEKENEIWKLKIKGGGLISTTLHRLKSAKGKSLLVAALITVIGWAIKAASSLGSISLDMFKKKIKEQPIGTVIKTGTAVGITDFLTDRNKFGDDYNPIIEDGRGWGPVLDGDLAAYVDKKSEVFTNRYAKGRKGQLELVIDSVISQSV